MKALIDLSEVADQLKNCKPGESKQVTFKVTSNEGGTIKGEATSADYADEEEEDYEEEDEEEEMPMRHGKKGKVPNAILLIAEK